MTKSVQISDKLHKAIRLFCAEHGDRIGTFIHRSCVCTLNESNIFMDDMDELPMEHIETLEAENEMPDK
jgi:hypothetical protein